MASTYNPIQEEEDKKEQAQQGDFGPVQTIGTAGSSPSGAVAAPEKRQQGSGRFTNLQKYVKANQGAGQRIAGEVGQKVGGQLDKQQQKASSYYSKLGDAIGGAQQTAADAAGYTQQLRDIGTGIEQSAYKAPEVAEGAEPPAAPYQPVRAEAGLAGIEAFTADEDKFKRFQDIQSGRAINEDLLGMRQKQAATGAQDYLGQTQKAKEALGTEGGRFDLLRQTFGGASRPGYTTGQQRLDQLFLTRGGLGGLKQDVSGRAKAAAELAKQSGKALGTVQNLAQQERGYMGDIGTQALANEQKYMDMLRSYIDPTNVGRQAEYEGLDEAFRSYLPQAPGTVQTAEYRPGFSAEEQARLGLSANQGVYDVFNNLSDVGQIATRGRDAFSAQDVAQQADVNRYQALAKMLGMDPSAQAITQATDIDPAWSAIEGEAGLAARLGEAEKQFQNILGNTTLEGGASKWDQIQRDEHRNLYADFDPREYESGVVTSMGQIGAKELLNQGLDANIDRSYTGGNSFGNYWAPISAGNAQHSAGSSGSIQSVAQGQQSMNQYINNILGPPPESYRHPREHERYNLKRSQLINTVTGKARGLDTTADQQIYDRFKNFLDAQNYNQTIGGRRTTFLDELAGGTTDTGKIGAQGPVTGSTGVSIPGKGTGG